MSEGSRQFTDNTLVIGSSNEGKIREIKALLEPYGIEVKGGKEFKLEDPEETADSFIGNAQIKSQYFATNTKLPCLSDDSGLVVPAIGGAPGIYSARWAGEDQNFNVAIAKVEGALTDVTNAAEDHEAHFVCALSLCWPDGHCENVEGKVFGKLTFPARGDKGFGYDPIFIPDGYGMTFGEMEPSRKNAISHRAKAFDELVRKCFLETQKASA